MVNRICYLIFLLLLACSKSKTDFVVQLTSESGYGPFKFGQMVLAPSFIPPTYQGVPEDIDEFVVRSLILQNDQHSYNLYLEKKIDKESFERVSEDQKIDTTQLSESYIDSEVLILIGTKSDKRIIIVDTDNDEDFNNEKVFEYEYPLSIERQKELSDSLPTVTVQYEYYDHDKKSNREILVKPTPYEGYLNITFYMGNETEKKYYLFASFPEYKKGVVHLQNTEHEVLLSNGFSQADYKTRVTVFIAPKSDTLPSELNGDIPYGIGDVFNTLGHDYIIDSVSTWGDELFIKHLGENTKPPGFTEGFYMPNFEAKRLDNSIFELNQYPGKYVLLDFWGTWCVPCIKLIPELKELNDAFSQDDFVLVSVAFDGDLKKVDDFVKKENMDWEHLFVNQRKGNKNSLVEKLKVSRYPTTVLIDPNGKLIARNKSIDELKQMLSDAFSTTKQSNQ